MTKQQAIDHLNDEWCQGDISLDTYEQEWAAIEYAHAEMMSALDEESGVAA